MKPTNSAPRNGVDELSALMETLRKTGQRLEELTAGQVDTVVDSDGRTLLLRGIQEQLQQSDNARQAAVLNALPAHIALLDARGIIISVNDAWRRSPNANVIQGSGGGAGLNYLEHCDRARGDGSSEAQMVAKGIRSVLNGAEKIFSAEYSCHSPTEQRWFQLVVTSLRDDLPVGAVVMHVNITERKQLEQARQQNQKQLRDLIDGLGPSIFVGMLTPHGNLIEANQSALTAAGLEMTDVLGKPFAETYWWSHSPKVQQQLREAIARAAVGKASRYDVQVRAAGGQLIDVDFCLQPTSDASGEIVYLVPSASVITERKVQERKNEALRHRMEQQSRLFDTTLSSIVDFVYILDRGSRFIYVNQALLDLWGLRLEDAVGKDFYGLKYPDELAGKLQRQVQQVFDTKKSLRDETPYTSPSGADGYYEYILSPVFDASGNVEVVAGSTRDITERKRVAVALRTSLDDFRTLAEAVPQMIWITRPDGGNVYFNRQWTDYTGITLEESIGSGWNKPFHPEDKQKAWDAWQRATATNSVYSIECRLRRADGVYRWWLIRGVPLLQDDTGTILKWFGTCTDIQDLKISEEALFAEKENAQIRLNSIGDAVICTDISETINYLNSIAEKMTGWTLDKAVGHPISEVLRIKSTASRGLTSNPIEEAIRQDKTVMLPADSIFVRRDEIEIPLEGSIAPIRSRESQAAGAIIVVRDVSAARSMSQRIIHLAEHDALTGLPNRLLLNDRINQAIVLAPRHKKQIALLFLDLDGFKHINDSLGHSIGDKLLQSIGNRLVDCVRATDTVSRQGGDEFVVLLSEVEHPEDAAIAARRMLKAVSERQSIDLHDLHLTTSIGLSVYPEDGLDAETLIKNADTAMYQAKENGRQSYQFFKPAMNARAVERQSIEENLRRALEYQEFTLHYQPKVNLRTGEIVGAEALLRWTHPTRGPISPGQFIPVAEDCGLILPIGQWVLREACQQTRAWAAAGLPSVTMAVNISAMEFRQVKFLENIFDILKETHVDPKSLELELTESILMKGPESATSVLRVLRAAGIQIAVDDFGTGYSSLSYLRKFPIDALKIDRSFVQQITITPDDTTIIAAIISMGRSMKLRVIAEGVETQKELEFLQAYQCDEAQGYYFSRPVLPEQFAKLLEIRNSHSGSVPAN